MDKENSFITITQVPRNSDDVRTYNISYSDIGLPPLLNENYYGNIFVDGDFLFFVGDYTLSVEPLESEIDVVKDFPAQPVIVSSIYCLICGDISKLAVCMDTTVSPQHKKTP